MPEANVTLLNAVNEHYGAVLKFVLSFQNYVVKNHSSTGLVQGFPELTFAPMTSKRVGAVWAENVCRVIVYPVDVDPSAICLYVNAFVNVIEHALDRAGARHKFEQYDGHTNWRTYIDSVFSTALKLLTTCANETD